MGHEREVVIIAEIKALPNKRAELKLALDRLVAKSSAETDVSEFRLHEKKDEPGSFALYERFADQDAVDRHVTFDHFAQILSDCARLAEGGKPKIAHYRPLTD